MNELFDAINNISYTIEYNANLEFAEKYLSDQLRSLSERKDWALKATNDTIEIDRENAVLATRNIRKQDALRKHFKAIAYRSLQKARKNRQSLQPNTDEYVTNDVLIDELTGMLYQLQI